MGPSQEKRIREMKPGDKVWYLDTARQQIASSIVTNVIHGECVGIETSGNFFLLGHDGFPTREALCEHYRKIFE